MQLHENTTAPLMEREAEASLSSVLALLADGGPVETVSLVATKPSIDSAGAAQLANALRASAAAAGGGGSVRKLDLSYNDLGPAGATRIAEVLRTDRGIATLDLGYNDICDAGVTAVAEALRDHNDSCTAVNLYGNRIKGPGVEALVEALGAERCAVRELDISCNGMGVGAAGAAHIAAALARGAGRNRLEVLYVYGNRLGAEGAALLAGALRANSALRELDVSDNGVGAAGATELASALRANASLQKLNLGFNAIGPEGAAALEEAVREANFELREVGGLGNGNGVGEAGREAIEALLARNAALAAARAVRSHMAAFRVHRFWRDVCYDPRFAHARARLLRIHGGGGSRRASIFDEAEAAAVLDT